MLVRSEPAFCGVNCDMWEAVNDKVVEAKIYVRGGDEKDGRIISGRHQTNEVGLISILAAHLCNRCYRQKQHTSPTHTHTQSVV